MVVGKENNPGSSILVIGEVVQFHVRKELWKINPENNRGRVDLNGLAPIGRMSGLLYSNIKEVYELENFSVKKPSKL